MASASFKVHGRNLDELTSQADGHLRALLGDARDRGADYEFSLAGIEPVIDAPAGYVQPWKAEVRAQFSGDGIPA